MPIHASPLADQFAGSRAAAASNDARGWLPACLHAMIMALLARVFARLEHLVLQCQAGQFPQCAYPQAPCTSATLQPLYLSTRAEPRHQPGSRRTCAAMPCAAAIAVPAIRAARPHPSRASAIAPSRAVRRAAPPRSWRGAARAPPASSRVRPLGEERAIASLILRYQNNIHRTTNAGLA